jgi:hypothetical protein
MFGIQSIWDGKAGLKQMPHCHEPFGTDEVCPWVQAPRIIIAYFDNEGQLER